MKTNIDEHGYIDGQYLCSEWEQASNHSDCMILATNPGQLGWALSYTQACPRTSGKPDQGRYHSFDMRVPYPL